MQELIEQKKIPIAENCFGDTFCIDSTDWYSPVENFKENKL